MNNCFLSAHNLLLLPEHCKSYRSDSSPRHPSTMKWWLGLSTPPHLTVIIVRTIYLEPDPTILSWRRVISTDGNQYSWGFRIILSNTITLSSFPCEDMRVKGSANARRMPAMIAHLTWMIYLGQSRAHAHHALQPQIMKLVKTLSRFNTLIAPCINEYWLPSVVVMNGACQSPA